METREVLIASTKTQTHTKLMTGAETLGELKADMTAAGIDYEDMSFTEGISKTELLNDDSLLPRNMNYKGTVTNNLIILLTNTAKKIASGAFEVEGTRKEAYDLIRELGLQERVKDRYGRNFTQVPTEDLWDFIGDYKDVHFVDEDECETEDVKHSENHPCLVEALYLTVKAMVKAEQFTVQDVDSLVELLDELAARAEEEGNYVTKVGNVTITKDDINAMIECL